MSSRKLWVLPLLAIVSVIVAFYCASHPGDFRVYYHGARGVFDGTRPVYGDTSGIGWPQHYRYPPLFILLFAPFTLLPLSWAAAVWAFLKCVVLALLVRYQWRQLGKTSNTGAWLIPVLLASPYVIEDLRYGNAQLFAFAGVAAALLCINTAPKFAIAALSIASIVKVWPLYFVPYLFARGERKIAARTVICVVLLALVPSVYFGFGGNLRLLQEWAAQEFSTQTGSSEIWFPSQSLRGVAMRYLTDIDYSLVPDSNYPAVNVMSLDPGVVRTASIALVVAIYAALLLMVFWDRRRNLELSDAAAIAMLPLLQPFTQKYALVVLLWPAITAGRLVRRGQCRALLYLSILFALIQPAIPGATAQRAMQALGFDFVVVALLTAFLLCCYRPGSAAVAKQ